MIEKIIETALDKLFSTQNLSKSALNKILEETKNSIIKEKDKKK